MIRMLPNLLSNPLSNAATLSSVVAFAFLGLGCSDATAPTARPPYLAIVTDLNALPGVVAPLTVHYRVTELSGTLGIDTAMTVAPGDTVIIPVPPATYTVEIGNFPATCSVKDGKDRSIVLTDKDNTGIIRYQIQCRGVLNVETATDGYDADESFIYRLSQPGGFEKLGRIGANDTLVFSDLVAGTYTMELAGIAPNCIASSDGGSQQTFTVDQTGGVTIGFRVLCARESQRPKILSMKSSYVLGSSVFIIKVYDPTRDVEGYTWDLTDCHQNSILPDKARRTRRGLTNGRTRLQDTLTIVGAYDVGLPTEDMQGKCTRIQVFDAESNPSEIVEHVIGSATGHPPQATVFNARLIGQSYVETTFGLTDSDGDIGGIFGAVRLRDGTLGPTDGNPDLGIMDPAGYAEPTVPNVRTDGRIQWDDVYAVIIWAIDGEGNAIRLEDGDVFR